MIKVKINSQKKGRDLEIILQELMKKVLKEWGFTPIEIRIQTSGYQFGKDQISRWVGELDGTTYEFSWSIESKNRGQVGKIDVIPNSELSAKYGQIVISSTHVLLDTWCVFSPFGKLENHFYEQVRAANENGSQAFSIMLWTSEQQIEDLIACFPLIYKEIYKQKPIITKKVRKETLEHWKEQIIIYTKLGKNFRETLRQSTKGVVVISDKSVEDVADSVAKRVKKELHDAIIHNSTQPSPAVPSFSEDRANIAIEKAKIKEQIEEAKVFLDRGDFPEAVLRFSTILPEVENKDGFGDELARVYNNIGVAYNAQGKIDESLKYFHKAVSKKPDFLIAQTNIANAYISKAIDLPKDKAQGELKKAEEILKSLWDKVLETKEARVLHAYLRLMELQHSPEEVLKFVNDHEKDELGTISKTNCALSFYIASIFLSRYELDKASQYSEIALKLDEDVETLTLHGRVLLAKSLKDDVLPQSQSYEDIAPQFGKTENLENALKDFDKAVSVALVEKNKLFFADAVQLVRLTRTWLNRKDELNLPKERELEIPQNNMVDAVEAFRNRDFEISFDLLQKMPEYLQLPPSEIHRFARAFLYNGAVEIARKLLLQVEQVFLDKKIFTYWIDRSMVEVLLQDKNQAILSANRAIEFADKPDKKQVAYSHAGAVLLRYASEDGGDRSLDVALRFDQEFPELGVLTRINFEKEKEKLIKMFQDRRNWVEDIQKKYKENPIPSYYLEKIFKRPFIAVWSGRDPLMPIEYTITSEEFHRELKENYSKGKVFVFDYIALLTVSKLNLLQGLEKFFPRIQITFSLFQKIQEELLQQENPDLRRLWEFIRRSKTIEIVKTVPVIELRGEKIHEIFEEWVIDTLRLAKQPNYVFITDDLRFYRFSKSQDIIPINTWYIVQQSLNSGLMDRVMYSKAIGSLAECFYTFVGFNGDDLYQILADDDFKKTIRVYHLIQQVFLPGSNPKSFTQVFVHFMSKLWRSGALSEGKVLWLSYLTNIFTDIAIHIVKSGEPEKTLGEIASDFGMMWNVALSSGRKDDLLILQRDLDKILENQSYSQIKKEIEERIKEILKK